MATTRPDASFVEGVLLCVTGGEVDVEVSARPPLTAALKSPLVTQCALILIIRLISLMK